MKIKSFLIMVLSLISLTVAAQNGGIKGKSYHVPRVRLLTV